MKNLKVNEKYFLGKNGVMFALALATAATFTACGKLSDCEMKTDHVHKYVNDNGYVRYIDNEKLRYEGYDWTDDYLEVEQDELDDRNFEDKKDLLRIDENLDTILAQQEENVDYMEYRYKYKTLMPIHVGKVTTYTHVTHYSWTKNENRSGLTGEQRICHYKYQAYKIEVNEKGKLVIVPSEYVDDLTTIMDEYPYVKEKYSKVFNKALDCEADYEDGPEKGSEEDNKDTSYNESSSNAQSDKVKKLN